jgi:hypothetical protein
VAPEDAEKHEEDDEDVALEVVVGLGTREVVFVGVMRTLRNGKNEVSAGTRSWLLDLFHGTCEVSSKGRNGR